MEEVKTVLVERTVQYHANPLVGNVRRLTWARVRPYADYPGSPDGTLLGPLINLNYGATPSWGSRSLPSLAGLTLAGSIYQATPRWGNY